MAEGGEKRSPTSHRTPSQIRRHAKTYGSRPDQRKNRVKRVQARRQLEKEGKVKKNDGKDVAHKKPLSKGGTNSRSNLTVQSRKKNRGHGMSRGRKG